MSSDGDTDPDEYEALEDAEVTTWIENGLHIAEDEVTGVSSQGPTERDALRNLAATVDSYREATSDDSGDDWL